MAAPQITEAAQKFMKRMVRFGGQGVEAGFRLTVKAGGCSGYDSSFSIEAAPFEGDSTLEYGGVKVFLPAESRIVLEGVTVDFSDSPAHTGLTFFNPAGQACACGTDAGAKLPPGAVTVQLDAIRRR